MSSGPKKQDYKASDMEKTSAAVAVAEKNYFDQNYGPLLEQMRDQSLTTDTQSTLRGRANADTMQALSGPSYQMANSTTAGGDLAQAYQGQLGVANTSAKDIQNKMQTNVLGVARGQAADAQTGMAEASRLATSEALTRAKAKQDTKAAKMDALGQIAGAFIMQGADNAGTKSADGKKQGSFFTPVDKQGNAASSFKQRLQYTNFLGG
jgi:hypothetical protein